jgi:pimeloyl-ACP methyl ester carboxylesterase
MRPRGRVPGYREAMTQALRAHIPGRFVRVGGTAHHAVVDDGPRGTPAVVFTSGLGGAWYDWDAVVPLLAGRATLVRFDRPGLGWSQPAPAPPTLAAEAARISDLTAALGVPGPYVVVGHSLAGFHVEAFARCHPRETAGVVIVDGSAEPDAIPSAGYRERLRFARAVGALAARTGVGTWLGPVPRRLAVAATTMRGPDAADPGDVAAVFRSGRALRTALLENTAYVDVAAELLELRCERPFPPVPLAVLAAFGQSLPERLLIPPGMRRRHRAQWLARQRRLADLSPLGELIELPDSAHFVPIDRPDAVAGAVLGILSGCSRPADPDGRTR